MKYVAILDTDEFKDFKFFEDADGKYLAVKDANAKSNEWLPLHFETLEKKVADLEAAKDTQRPTANLVVAGPAKAGQVYASCSICDRAWVFSERRTKKSLHAHMLEETPYCNCGAKFVGVVEDY
jgi:hypothetical protein